MGYKERYEERQKNKNTTKATQGYKERYEARQQMTNLASAINFDTLSADLSSMGKTIEGIYNGWQTQETMNNTRSSVESMQNRLKAYKEYSRLFGGADAQNTASKLVESYGNVLDGWDDMTEMYGRFPNADAFNVAKKNAQFSKQFEGLSYDDVQTKLGEYDADSDEYNFLKNYTQYTDLREFDKALESTPDKKSDYYKDLQEARNKYKLDNAFDLHKDVMQNEDFTEKSKYVSTKGDFDNWWEKFNRGQYSMGYGDITYEYINNANGIRDEISRKQSIYSKDSIFPKESMSDKGYDRLNPEEVAVYNYWHEYDKEHGTNKAQEFLDDMQVTLSKRIYDEQTKQWKDATDKGGVSATLTSALTVPANMVGAFYGTIDTLTSAIKGEEYNPYSYYKNPSNFASDTRGYVSENIEEATEGLELFGQNIPAFLYQTGMSVLDSKVGGAYLGSAHTALMGLNAYQQKAKELTEEGVDASIVQGNALVTGALEAAFEYAGFEHLMKMKNSDNIFKVVKNALKSQGVVEGLEELGTAAGNIITDLSFRGKDSEYIQKYNSLIERGFSKKEAITETALAVAGELGWSFAGGFLSGVTLGGTQSYNEYRNLSFEGQNIKANERVSEVFDIASTSPEISSAYEAYTRYANKGINADTITDAQLGNIYSSAMADAMEIRDSKKSTPDQKEAAKKRISDLETYAQYNPSARISKKSIKQYDADTVNALIAEGLESDENTSSYQLATEYKAKIESGKKLSTNEIQRLVEANDEAFKAEDKKSVTERLAELGESSDVADIVTRKMRGERITIAEAEKLNASKNGLQVLAENTNEELVDYVKTMDNGADANLFISLYDGSTDVEAYANAFSLTTAYARGNFTYDTILKNKGVLSTEQVKAIYAETRIAADKAKQNKINILNEKMANVLSYKGFIKDSAITDEVWEKLDSRQRQAVTFIKGFAQATGMNLVLTHNPKSKHGGSYTISNNTITIDIAKYKNIEKGLVETIIPTMSHEVTHWMEEKAPELWRSINELVFSTLQEADGYSEVDRIAIEIERLKEKGRKATESEARSEIIARACEDMLSMSEQGKKMFSSLSESEQKTFVEKIKELIQNLKDWVSELLGLYKSDSYEAKLMREYQDKLNELSKLWDEMLQKSVEANQALEKSGAFEKESSTDGKVLEQAREIDANGNAYWQIETDKDIFKGINSVKGLQRAAYNYILSGDKGNKVIGLIDGKNLEFIRVSAREYVYGDSAKSLSTEEYKQKMRMSTSIIDLIDNAPLTYDAPDHKNHKMFPNGFKNYQGRVGIDDTIFRYIVRVGKAKNGMIFYDINLEVDGKVPHAKRISLIKSPTSTNNISNYIKNVNTKFSDRNDTIQPFEKSGAYGNESSADGDVLYALREEARTEIEQAISNKNYDKEIKLTDSSPAILTSQKGVRDLPMMIKASHARENILTEEEAEEIGLSVRSDTHFHGLGKDLFLKVIEGLDGVTRAYRGTKNAEKSERRENYFLLVSQYKDADGNIINIPVYINEGGIYNRVYIDTNKIATVFGRNEFEAYIKRELAKGNLVRIKNRSTQASESSPPIGDNYSKNASTDIISDSPENVNTKFSDRNDTIQPLEKSGAFEHKASFNSDGDVKYSIRETTDGIQYVVLDKNIFLDKAGKELSPRQAYNSLVGQKIMFEDGDVITFVKRLPGNRDMYNELFKRYPAFKDVMNIKGVNEAINKNMLETIEASKIAKRNEPQRYKHLGVVDFDKREVYVTDETVVYKLILSIANLTDGKKVAYAKSFIENASVDIVKKIKKAETVRKSRLNQLSDIIISDSPENVNTKFSDRNDTIQPLEKSGAYGNKASAEGVKFQTRSVNGNEVVWIDENILKLNNGKPVHQFIADFIVEHIGDVYTIIESGQKVYIGDDLPGEYTQSKYTQKVLQKNPNIIKAKNKATANIKEIIEIATNRRWEKTEHTDNKDAKYGMYRYDTRFGFPVSNSKGNIVRANIYKAELVIRNASDGRKYLYDIVDIKKDTVASDWLSEKIASAADFPAGQKNNVSKNSITNSSENVNTKFSDRNDTIQPLEKSGAFEHKANAEGVKFSEREIIGVSGTNYGIGVYLDSNLLTGLTEDERKQMVKEYVVTELAGQNFVAYDNNNNAVDIRIATKGEKFRNEKGKNRNVLKELYNKYNGFTIKQEAVVLIDELIANAKFDSSSPAKHKHGWLDNNGKNDWDIWTVFIQEKNKSVWEATLNIANTANGEKILYDIGPIKMVEQASKSATSTTNNIISDSPENVNTKFSDRDYSYESFVAKPNMKLTLLDDNVPNNRADIIYQAKKNARKVGSFDAKNKTVSVFVDDIGKDVVLGTKGLRHGLRRAKTLQEDANSFVTLKAGEIIKNSICINELTPEDTNADSSYVLIGAATRNDGSLYIVESVINQYSNQLVSMDVLYSVNAKKENRLRSMRPEFLHSVTDSTISIADLLDNVNNYFPDILPESVLRHYNYDARPDGELGESVLFSDRETEYTEQEYRDYGWARANGILNEGQNADYRSKFADAVSGHTKFNKSKRGEYIIPVSDIYDSTMEGIDNVLVFAKGTIDKPVITSIIEIYEYDETILDNMRRYIYESERRGIQPEIRESFGRYYSYDFRRGAESQEALYTSTGHSGDNRFGGRNRGKTETDEEGTESVRLYSDRETEYTEQEYRDYGWARANGVLNEGQNADYRSKFADAVSGHTKFNKSKRGEYIIPVSDIYDSTMEGIDNILVFAMGNIDNPIITSIIEIYELDETRLDDIRRYIYESERRGIQQKTGETFERYYAYDFRLGAEQQEAFLSSFGFGGDNRFGGRNRQGIETDEEGTESVRLYSDRETEYTEQEYRDYGWARANGVLNEGQNADYRSKFADAVSGHTKFNKSKRGEYIIPVSDIYDSSMEGIDNILVFAKGTIDKPVITSIIEIYEYDETNLDITRRNIYDLERRGIQQTVGETFGRYDAVDFATYYNGEYTQGSGYDNGDRFGRSNREQGEGIATFSEESKGIRLYSDRDNTSVYDIMGERDRLLKENEKFKADIDRLNKRLKLERKVTNGTVLNNNQLLAAAGHLRKIANSNMDKVTLAKALKEVYSYIINSRELTWQEVFSRCYNVADEMLKEAKPTVEVNYYYKQILSDIRKTRISLSESQKSEAKDIFDKNWNRYFIGKVVIANDGIGIEAKWQEWAELYPDIFTTDISDGDMIGELYDIINSLQEASETVMEYDDTEQKRWLAREIYNQYWNVSTIKTTADKYDAQIKRLNFEHRKAMTEMRNDYQERLKKNHQADKERYKQLVAKIRERKDNEIALAKQHGKERLSKYKENAERKTRIHSITANALSLNEMLVKNSKDKHIPEIMKGPVVKLLQSIDFSSKRLLENGKPTQKDASFAKALSKVKDMMVKASNGHDELVELYGHGLDEDIEKMVDNVDAIMELIEDNEFVLNKMSLIDLQTLDKLVKTIKHAVNKMNKFHTVNHAKGIANLSQESVLYLDSLGKGKIYDGLRGGAKKLLDWGNALPYYAFKRYGKGGMKVYEALQDGWDKFAFNVKAAIDYANSTYTSKEVKEWSKDIKAFEILMPGTDKYQKVQMTVPQIMSMYCLAKREQARGHLFKGGIRVADFKDAKGKVVSQSEGVIFTIKDVQTIFDSLTERQKAVADKLQEFMNTVCSDWGNEVSMARFGYKAFGEENYFPIQSDDNNLTVNDATEQPNSLFKLLNMSFTKAVDPNADNRIVISDIFDVFAQHTSDMAKYNALALPVLDAFKWYNYKEKIFVSEENFQTKSVKQSMENAFGGELIPDKGGKEKKIVYAQEYFTTFLKDINGSQEVSRDTLGKGFFSNAKIASVGANLRVVLLQPTSYARASAVIDNRYLLRALGHKPKIKRAETHCGIALWKAMGYYDTNIQRGVEAQIKHNDTWKDKATEWSMKGAEWADKFTWGYLWNACELEIRDTRKDLKVGSEEFYTEIGKRLREVIYATQVVDSTMTRSQMMRSTDGKDKMLTAFASEPTLAYNMLQDAYMTLQLDARRMGKKEAWKKNGKRMARIVTAYTMTNALAALVEAAFDAYRDDDEEKDLIAFMKLYLKNFAFDMSIGSKIPYVKELYSFMQGFGSSRTDTQWMENMTKAITTWYKIFNGKKNAPTTAIKYSIKALSDLSGIPFYNVYRDAMAGLNKFDLFTADDLNEMFEGFLD